ncbi:MAG: PAS domain S-box protein [Pseudomonadota bacterium]
MVCAAGRAGDEAAGRLAGLGWEPVHRVHLDQRPPVSAAPPAADLVLADLAGSATPAALVGAQSLADKLGLPLVCRLQAAEVAALIEARPGLVLGRVWLEHWDAERAVQALAEATALLPQGQAACRQFCARLRDSEQTSLCEMLRLVGQNLPDLVWAKDLDDRFLYVNQAMCDKLLKCVDAAEALGRDDLHFAGRERAAGHQHTFGELCVNSDGVVKRSGRAGVFLEEGLVRGESLALQVHKAPIVNDQGKMVGTVGLGRDVTTELAMSRRLMESERRHRAIVDNLDQGIMVAQDGVLKFANAWFQRAFGIPVAEAVGQPVGGFIHPEDREAVVENHRRRIAGQPAPGRYSFRLLDAAGKPHWVMLNAIQAQWEGRPAAMGFVIDISEQLAAERELKASEKRLRTTFEQAAVGMCEVDTQGRFLKVNRCLCRMCGFSEAELVGRNFLELTHPDDVADSLRLLARALAGEIDDFATEKRYRRRDGSLLQAQLNATLVRESDGNPSHFFNVVQDIGPRRAAEVALKAQEGRFRTLVENLPGLVYRCELGVPWQVNYMSEGALAVTGYSPADFTAHRIDFGRIILPADLPEVARVVDEAVQSRRSYQVEYRIRHADGQPRWVFEKGRAIYDEAGEPLYLDGVILDINPRKQAEEEKDLLERQLRQSQKMEAVGALAGGIAHDFNNLLGAISGYAELGLELAGQGRDNSSDLKQVLAATERARRLVRQILTFSRRAESELKPLDLNREVAEAVRMLEHAIPKMIALKLELAADLPAISADPVQVNQILLNLASNAQDAMPQGGLLTIATQAVSLDQDLNLEQETIPAGEYVLLCVSDSGQGMDASTQQHIFEPFFTTKPFGRGTGLGLSTVFGVVKGHRGYIVCQSGPGRGARFLVYLPALAGPAAAAAAAGPEPGPNAGGAETVLVVDDEAGLVTVARRTLESHGYRVLTAGSGEQALELLAGDPGPVDLILLDLGMPGMGGARCLGEIKARRPDALVVITTGYAPDTLADPALEAAAGYLAKPYRRADLLAAVRQALDR